MHTYLCKLCLRGARTFFTLFKSWCASANVVINLDSACLLLHSYWCWHVSLYTAVKNWRFFCLTLLWYPTLLERMKYQCVCTRKKFPIADTHVYITPVVLLFLWETGIHHVWLSNLTCTAPHWASNNQLCLVGTHLLIVELIRGVYSPSGSGS